MPIAQVRYATLLVTFFVCVLFSAGLPCLWFIGAASFTMAYLVDKVT